MITKKCDECGKGFEVDDSKRNWQHIIVCSDQCQKDRAARKRREKYVKQEWPQKMVCEWCGKKFLVYNAGQKSRRKYCERECYLAKKKDERNRETQINLEKKICLSCGKSFIPSKFTAVRQKYCSRTCFRREMWKKHEEPNRTQYAFNRIREHILQEYKRTCQLCGSTKKPHVHHLDGRRDENGLNNSVDNLTVLCRECHNHIHRVTVVKEGSEWKVSGKIFEILGLEGSIKIT